MDETQIIRQSVHDLQEDIAELKYLAIDCDRKINAAKKHLTHTAEFKHRNIDNAFNLIHPLAEVISNQIIRIRSLEDMTQSVKTTFDLAHIAAEKLVLYQNQRTISSGLGNILTSHTWQSPSYKEHGVSMSGTEKNQIKVAINDYKRGHHNLAVLYESAFRNENIDGFYKPIANVYTTSSGMAAFTTIVNYLTGEKYTEGPIIAGESTYWEAKELLMRYFGNRIAFLREDDTKHLIAEISKIKPRILFFDTVGNTPDMLLPDITAICTAWKKFCPVKSALVLDNSCLSVALSLPQWAARPFASQTLIVYESLNKFHQFGLDRTTGGIIWSVGRNSGKLFTYRTYSGTVIPDTSVAQIPTPNRVLLAKRLVRIYRNAEYMAHTIGDFIANHKSKIESVVYPGLTAHPSHDRASIYRFGGPFLMLNLKKPYRTGSIIKKLAMTIIERTQKHTFPLVAGTSFGFPVTRVYPTALLSKNTAPFFRIAPGTETVVEIQGITTCIIDAISSL